MKKVSKNVLIWEIISALFVIFVGSALHFVFAASGYNNIVGAFSAVNESTWEHTKLAFVPLIVFSLIQYPFVKKEIKNYFLIKAKESHLAVFLIIMIFYTYTGIIGHHYLWVDILTFIIAVIAAKALAYIHLFNWKKRWQTTSIIVIIILALFFIYATYNPPKIQLFLDTPTGTYGMVVK